MSGAAQFSAPGAVPKRYPPGALRCTDLANTRFGPSRGGFDVTPQSRVERADDRSQSSRFSNKCHSVRSCDCKPTRLRASTPTPLVAGVLPLGSSGVQARFPCRSPRAGPDDRHRPAGPALGESRGGGEPGGRTLQRRSFDRSRRPGGSASARSAAQVARMSTSAPSWDATACRRASSAPAGG
jgi:hypothetical protein